MSYAEDDAELERIAVKMNEIVISMFGLAATGIRGGGPAPPPPKHLEQLTKIIGAARLAETTALAMFTGQIRGH